MTRLSRPGNPSCYPRRLIHILFGMFCPPWDVFSNCTKYASARRCCGGIPRSGDKLDVDGSDNRIRLVHRGKLPRPHLDIRFGRLLRLGRFASIPVPNEIGRLNPLWHDGGLLMLHLRQAVEVLFPMRLNLFHRFFPSALPKPAA